MEVDVKGSDAAEVSPVDCPVGCDVDVLDSETTTVVVGLVNIELWAVDGCVAIVLGDVVLGGAEDTPVVAMGFIGPQMPNAD